MAGSRESLRTTSQPPGSYELSWLFPLKQGQEAESSYEPGGSDVVRELSREPAMFQIGLQGKVLIVWKLQVLVENLAVHKHLGACRLHVPQV